MDKLLVLVFVLQCLYRVLGLYEVTNLACNPTSSTVLVFTWSRPNDPSRNVVGYKLNLERTDNVKVDVIPEQNVNDYYTETYTFSGLNKYGIYTLKLNTYTATGNEPDQFQICQTLTDVPAQAPTKVEAVGISYSEITVEWSEIAQEYRHGVLLGYKLIYYTYKSSFPVTTTVDNSTLNYKITGLEFDTYYLVGVKAYTSAGDGPTTTDSNKTLGLATQPPAEVVRYYCNEAIPGLITISWDSMPCTIYVGTIGFLFTFCCIFGVGCCIACCSKKPPIDPDAGMGVGGGGHSNGPSYDTESYHSNEYEEKRHKSAGNITARDVWISSPGPSEFESDYYNDTAPTAPKSSIMLKIGKNIIEQNRIKEENHSNPENHDDEKDSVYFSEDSAPGTRRSSVELLNLADLEEGKSILPMDYHSARHNMRHGKSGDDDINDNNDENDGDDGDVNDDGDEDNINDDETDDDNEYVNRFNYGYNRDVNKYGRDVKDGDDNEVDNDNNDNNDKNCQNDEDVKMFGHDENDDEDKIEVGDEDNNSDDVNRFGRDDKDGDDGDVNKYGRDQKNGYSGDVNKFARDHKNGDDEDVNGYGRDHKNGYNGDVNKYGRDHKNGYTGDVNKYGRDHKNDYNGDVNKNGRDHKNGYNGDVNKYGRDHKNGYNGDVNEFGRENKNGDDGDVNKNGRDHKNGYNGDVNKNGRDHKNGYNEDASKNGRDHKNGYNGHVNKNGRDHKNGDDGNVNKNGRDHNNGYNGDVNKNGRDHKNGYNGDVNKNGRDHTNGYNGDAKKNGRDHKNGYNGDVNKFGRDHKNGYNGDANKNGRDHKNGYNEDVNKYGRDHKNGYNGDVNKYGRDDKDGDDGDDNEIGNDSNDNNDKNGQNDEDIKMFGHDENDDEDKIEVGGAEKTRDDSSQINLSHGNAASYDGDNQSNDFAGEDARVDDNASVKNNNDNSSRRHPEDEDEKSRRAPIGRLRETSQRSSHINKEETGNSESSDDDDIPILFPKKPVEPRVISVKEHEKKEEDNKRNIFKLKDDKPVHMAPSHFNMDNLFLCKMRNEGGSKMRKAVSKVMMMNKATKGMQSKNIYDKKDEKPETMVQGHFNLDNMFLCRMRKEEPKMKRVASDVMTMNMATNAMQNKGMRKNASLPSFGALSRNSVAPDIETQRSNLGRNRTTSSGNEDGLGGEHFYKLDSLFLVGKNKQTRNVKANLDKDFFME